MFNARLRTLEQIWVEIDEGRGIRTWLHHLPVVARLSDTYEPVAICDKDEEMAACLAVERG